MSVNNCLNSKLEHNSYSEQQEQFLNCSICYEEEQKSCWDDSKEIADDDEDVSVRSMEIQRKIETKRGQNSSENEIIVLDEEEVDEEEPETTRQLSKIKNEKKLVVAVRRPPHAEQQPQRLAPVVPRNPYEQFDKKPAEEEVRKVPSSRHGSSHGAEQQQSFSAFYMSRGTGKTSSIIHHYHQLTGRYGNFGCRKPGQARLLDTRMAGQFNLFDRRVFIDTTAKAIQESNNGMKNPRVGRFQPEIPGSGWMAVRKYPTGGDVESRNRSRAFGELMHSECEVHVDNMLANGQRPVAVSAVAKAAFHCCSPCLRSQLEMSYVLNVTFVMCDVAEKDNDGHIHFFIAGEYLPLSKPILRQYSLLYKTKTLVCEAMHTQWLPPVMREKLFTLLSSSTTRAWDGTARLNRVIDADAKCFYETALQRAVGGGGAVGGGAASGGEGGVEKGVGQSLRGKPLMEYFHYHYFSTLAAEYGRGIIATSGDGDVKKSVDKFRDTVKAGVVRSLTPLLSGNNCCSKRSSCGDVGMVAVRAAEAFVKSAAEHQNEAVTSSSSSILLSSSTSSTWSACAGVQGGGQSNKRAKVGSGQRKMDQFMICRQG